MQTAVAALALGHWPFSTPLLDMSPTDPDWIVACTVIDQAFDLRWPNAEGS